MFINFDLDTFYNIEIRKVVDEDKVYWWAATDICKILEIKQTSSAIKRLRDDNKKLLPVKTNGGIQKLLVLNKEGIKRLIITSKKPNAIELADYLNIEILPSSKEQDYIRVIQAAFKQFNSITQFYILGYRIDLYFPIQKVAVECDEFNHKKYNCIQEQERENLIKSALNCIFIRFNPDEPNFNIGNTINKLMHVLYKNKI